MLNILEPQCGNITYSAEIPPEKLLSPVAATRLCHSNCGPFWGLFLTPIMFVRLVGVRKRHAGEFLSYIQHEEEDSDRQGSQNNSCSRWFTLCISLQARWKRATIRPQLMPSAKRFLATVMKTSWAQFPWTWFISLMGGNGHIQIWEWFDWTDLLTQIFLASTVHS